ncbi:MAG: iron ABC transporter permease [Clostridia bacterium]|nr:iron ABC transporter permease [Clostridia bacterium]
MAKYRYGILFILLLLTMVAVLIGNIFIGSADISIKEILFGKAYEETVYNILFRIRLPRVLGACILGGALALSGYLLQTFFHNPIAGPFILGISSGAKLIVAIVMIFSASLYFRISSAFMIVSAFLGSMVTLVLVLIISRKVRNTALLVVVGVMIGYICSAVTDFIVTFADDSDIVNLRNWSMGSFSGMTMENVGVMAVVVFLCLVMTFLLAKPISVYQLGENYALNLGVNVKALKVWLIVLSGMFSACVTAFAGPVSFVGIAVPHIIKAIFKTAKPLILIPACFMGGSIFCMVCDMIARTVFSPTELGISTVTAIFGSPVVIWVMLRKKKGQF